MLHEELLRTQHTTQPTPQNEDEDEDADVALFLILNNRDYRYR